VHGYSITTTNISVNEQLPLSFEFVFELEYILDMIEAVLAEGLFAYVVLFDVVVKA